MLVDRMLGLHDWPDVLVDVCDYVCFPIFQETVDAV